MEDDPLRILVEDYGYVQGTIEEGNEKSYDAWYGIPFAVPPTGHLRFEVITLGVLKGIPTYIDIFSGSPTPVEVETHLGRDLPPQCVLPIGPGGEATGGQRRLLVLECLPTTHG